ncbi:hypothetical protein Y032_0011g1357 [Ancylostoma ceylanicum]|nr:hypothetical protein Y032_0011g1357 [Ancylostoma ceylanicum]
MFVIALILIDYGRLLRNTMKGNRGTVLDNSGLPLYRLNGSEGSDEDDIAEALAVADNKEKYLYIIYLFIYLFATLKNIFSVLHKTALVMTICSLASKRTTNC